MDAISYWVNKGAFQLYFAVLLSPIMLVGAGLAMGLRALLGPGDLILVLVMASALMWQGTAAWLAHKAAGLRIFGNQGFFAAAGGAMEEGKLYLVFVPGLGRLFAPRDKT